MKARTTSSRSRVARRSTAKRSDDTFRWRTNDGDILTPAQMDTSHLFNSLRMVFNHTVPEDLRLVPYREWKMNSDGASRLRSLEVFMSELKGRDDVTEGQRAQIAHMRKHLPAFKKAAKGIRPARLNAFLSILAPIMWDDDWAWMDEFGDQ